MKKRGMNTSVFTYVFGLVVVSIILILGFKLVANLTESNQDQANAEFKEQISKDIESVRNEKGSISIIDYNLPTGVEEMCFVDVNLVNTAHIINHPLILDSVESKVPDNVFFIGKSFGSTEVDHLKLNPPYFYCIKNNEGTSIEYVGQGEDALIKTEPLRKYCDNAEKGNLCDELNIVFDSTYEVKCCEEYGLCC